MQFRQQLLKHHAVKSPGEPSSIAARMIAQHFVEVNKARRIVGRAVAKLCSVGLQRFKEK